MRNLETIFAGESLFTDLLLFAVKTFHVEVQRSVCVHLLGTDLAPAKQF